MGEVSVLFMEAGNAAHFTDVTNSRKALNFALNMGVAIDARWPTVINLHVERMDFVPLMVEASVVKCQCAPKAD